MSNLKLDFAPEKTQMLPQLLYISYSRYERNWANIMHSHSFTEFLYIEKGEGYILTRGGGFHVKVGDFVLLPPSLYHTEKSSDKDDMEYYALGVSNIVLKETLLRESYNPLFPLGEKTEKIGASIRRIFEYLSQEKAGMECAVYSIFLDIISSLMSFDKSPFLIRETAEENTLMVGLKDYIDTHYMENFNLDDLASLFHLSKYHLVREFSHFYSLSPMAYLEERRIREAKYLLSSTDLSITVIAQTLAFSSSSYFSQRFRLLTGVTPHEYRKRKVQG